MSAFGLFSFCRDVFSSLDMMWWVLPYVTVFCFALFGGYLLGACSFLLKDRKGVDLGGEERWEGPWRSGGRGSCNQDILYEKILYFQ